MSISEQQGARELALAHGTMRILPGPPMIAPARQYVFPMQVPGEEEALQRGSIYVEATPAAGGTFLAQCAVGFSGAGVAHGLWPSPQPSTAIVAAGGYAYLLDLAKPERTALLPLRPVVGVLSDAQGARSIFVGHHHVLVCEVNGECWQSGRISWEGVHLSALENGLLRGSGWDMFADKDVPFSLDLTTREFKGGGYRQTR